MSGARGILKEGEYCPECDMRQAVGYQSHTPKCGRKPKRATPKTMEDRYNPANFEQDLRRDGVNARGFKDGSAVHQVLEILREKGRVHVGDVLEKMVPPYGERTIRSSLTQLRIAGMVKGDGHGTWELARP